MIVAKFDKTFNSWWSQATIFLENQILPHQINWDSGQSDLFGASTNLKNCFNSDLQSFFKSDEFKKALKLLRSVIMIKYDDKWDLMYQILYRMFMENRNLLSLYSDDHVKKAFGYHKSIGRDIHKMHAFVRFKYNEYVKAYFCFYEPEHLITSSAAPFFARRFGDKPWCIETPHLCAHWNMKEIIYTQGVSKPSTYLVDDWEEVWKTYYKSTYNPNRINSKMMKQEMQTKYWKNLPEVEIINDLMKEFK